MVRLVVRTKSGCLYFLLKESCAASATVTRSKRRSRHKFDDAAFERYAELGLIYTVYAQGSGQKYVFLSADITRTTKITNFESLLRYYKKHYHMSRACRNDFFYNAEIREIIHNFISPHMYVSRESAFKPFLSKQRN